MKQKIGPKPEHTVKYFLKNLHSAERNLLNSIITNDYIITGKRALINCRKFSTSTENMNFKTQNFTNDILIQQKFHFENTLFLIPIRCFKKRLLVPKLEKKNLVSENILRKLIRRV